MNKLDKDFMYQIELFRENVRNKIFWDMCRSYIESSDKAEHNIEEIMSDSEVEADLLFKRLLK